MKTIDLIKNAKPGEMVTVRAAVPVYLLNGAKKRAEISKIIIAALERTHHHRHVFRLRETHSLIKENIEDLEILKDHGPVGNDPKIDDYHLKLLELYKKLYRSISESGLLKGNQIINIKNQSHGRN